MILLLAGTAEARQIATGLQGQGIPVLGSLAGAVARPRSLPVPTRIGGFGGPEGFRAVLREHGIRAVIDATHPFAARITGRTAAICAQDGLPLLRVQRPGWTAGPGETWYRIDALAQAASLIPRGARVFLATGGQSLPDLAPLAPDRTLFLRRIDPGPDLFPYPPGAFVIARPPFDQKAEMALFRQLRITHLVAKDSGGANGRTKLDAARALGLPVILLNRPALPAGLALVGSAAGALAWVAGL